MKVYEIMKKYKVEAESIEDFCDKYHKPFSNYGNPEFAKKYRDECLKTYKKDLERYGYVMIPKSTTKTGLTVVYYED